MHGKEEREESESDGVGWRGTQGGGAAPHSRAFETVNSGLKNKKFFLVREPQPQGRERGDRQGDVEDEGPPGAG